MKKYEYYRVSAEGVTHSRLEEHREIIDRFAAEGWRYVGFIPVHENSYGMLHAVDLIFEQDAN